MMTGAMLKFMISFLQLVVCAMGRSSNTTNQEETTPPPNFLQPEQVRSKYYTWTLLSINAPFARCLVYARSHQGAAPTTHTICDRRYSKADIMETIKIWTKQRNDIGTVEMTCSVKHDNTGNHSATLEMNSCVCSRSTSKITQIQTLSFWVESHVKHSDIRDISMNKIGHQSDDVEGNEYDFTSCQYPKHLQQQVFDGLSGVRVLKIHDIPIESIQPAALQAMENSLQYLRIENVNLTDNGLPDGLLCHMANLSIIVVRNISSPFTVFPSKIFTCPHDNVTGNNPRGLHKVIGVFFEGNNFPVLPHRMLGEAGPALVALNLTANNITEIHPMAFERFLNLTELNLSHNKLTTIHKDIFKTLKSLLYLNLGSNTLEHLTMLVFRPLSKLKQLVLSNNQLNLIDGSFAVLSSLQLLHLDHNRLNHLSNSMFRNAHSIIKLYLNHNSIKYFEEDAFSSLLFLRALELRNNRIHNATNIQATFHGKMEYLGYIGLAHNNLTIILNNMFQIKPYVHPHEILDLSFNQISEIEPNAFQYMEQLYLLSLNHNEITTIEPGTFSGLRRLSLLWLDINKLKYLPPDWLPNSILWLSLISNELTEMPNVTKPYPFLQQIYISHNKISSLDHNSLQYFPSLRLLNVTNCRLKSLGELTFVGLRNIQAMDLSYNFLSLNFSIDYWGRSTYFKYLNLSHNAIGSAADLFKHNIRFTDYLDISFNPLHYFPNQIKERPFQTVTIPVQVPTRNLYMRNCSLRGIHQKAFDNMPNLLLLDLSSNLLTEFQPFRINTQYDELYFVYLYDNPIQCTCTMQWLHLRPRYKLSQCTLAMDHQPVDFNTISKDKFLCKEDIHCLVNPEHCDCYTDNATTRTVTYLDCSRRGLHNLPDNIPASVKHLELGRNCFFSLTFNKLPLRMNTIEMVLAQCQINSLMKANFRKFPLLEILHLNENNIKYMTRNVLAGLYRLIHLNLHGNQILQIDSYFFHSIMGIQTLTLHDNDIVTLDNDTMVEIAGLPYLKRVTLHGNPWECTCDNATFKQWLQAQTEKIPDVHDVMCNGTPIITLPDEDFECYDRIVYLERTEYDFRAITATATIAAIIAMVTLALVLVYVNRRLLEVLLFHKFGWRFSKHPTNPDAIYDGYAVYTHGNGDIPRWIRTVLMPRLEPPFRLFIADRDSLPGRVQTEEIMKTIKESTCSIFFLCQYSLKDDLFLYAFQTAFNFVTQENSSHQITLVVMDDLVVKEVINNDDLDPHLLAFLKTKQYICTNDKRFWKKLLFFMPDPKPKADPNDYVHHSNHISPVTMYNLYNPQGSHTDHVLPAAEDKETHAHHNGYVNC